MGANQWLGRQLRTLYRRVVKRGIGIYRTASAGKERLVDTRRGQVRVLEYGFDSTEPVPLFVDLHGGGFVLGSADMDEAMCLEFLSAGMKVISIDYPKAPEHPYPAAVEAIHDVISWYVLHGAELGLDTKRMAIGGHSAGGNLATVTCLNDLTAGKFHFRCQILDYPALDCATPPADKPQPKGALPVWMAKMFNACYTTVEHSADIHVSPVFAEPEELAGMPPALLLVCGHDSLHDEAVRYADTLRAAGVIVTVLEYPGEAHGFTYNKSDSSLEAIARMVAFLKGHLG